VRFFERIRALRRKDFAGPGRDPPVLLVKWYDFTRWLLERVDSFPKNQRFIFGTRLADHALDVMETLVEASYSRRKTELLARANRKIEMLRWLVRLAKDRKVLTENQYLFACSGLTECGRMVGGWLKQSSGKERPIEDGMAYEAAQAPV
jgi:hypothetical protein